VTRPASLVVLALAVILTALGGRFAVHMLQLARKGEARDFAAVYTSAYVYREGGDFYDAQPDREHFGANENPALIAAAKRLGTLHAHEGFEHVHVFSYPPLTVLPFVPFTMVGFRAAAVAWQVLSLGFLALAGWSLWRAVPLSPVAGLVLAAVALVYEPLENSLGLGQINLLVLALTCVFLRALVAGREALAGVALGVATALRVHPALFLLYLAWRRRWRAFAWGGATAAACTVLAIPLVGWDATVEYATLVAPKYARAHAGLGGVSLTNWLLFTGAALVPASPQALWRRLGQGISLAMLAGAFLLLRPSGPVARERLVPEVAFLVTVLYLVVPNTTINHLVFTFIPLAVLLERGLGDGAPGPITWLAVAILLIGAVDDYYMHPLLANGPLVLLGGIKTYGLVILAARGARLVQHAAVEAA
jgi:hypothetical protein